MGLFNVKRIVESFGGTIEASNEKNGGSIFTVYLPKKVLEIELGEGKMIKVVIAEDDFRIAQVQEQFLQKITGIKLVGKALNAKETMEILSKNEVDLLLLDIYMPDELGTDLLAKIREYYPSIDIIMVTAATERAMLEKAIKYGVVNYLLKPVTMEKFVGTIEEYKRKRELLSHRDEVDQTLIDRFFGISTQSTAGQTRPSNRC